MCVCVCVCVFLLLLLLLLSVALVSEGLVRKFMLMWLLLCVQAFSISVAIGVAVRSLAEALDSEGLYVDVFACI